MPHTTYGLLKAIRSHQISSPNVATDLKTGRPNACNLCHLDRTLGWTAQHLRDWYKIESGDLPEEQTKVAASVISLLQGDAGQRALVAWSMGWAPALEVSGRDWQAPFLAVLLEDPYDAVRFIAQRSLGSLPGFESFRYDFVGSVEERRLARERAFQIWLKQTARGRTEQALLLDAEGGVRFEDLERLLSRRDDRPVNLTE